MDERRRSVLRVTLVTAEALCQGAREVRDDAKALCRRAEATRAEARAIRHCVHCGRRPPPS